MATHKRMVKVLKQFSSHIELTEKKWFTLYGAHSINEMYLTKLSQAQAVASKKIMYD